MANYQSVAALRSALTDDDPAVRSEAYGVVLRNDVEPTAVLSDDPPEAALQEAGVVATPEEVSTRDTLLSEVVELLEEIAENTGGSA